MKAKTSSLFHTIVISLVTLTAAHGQTNYTWAPGGVQDAAGTWDTTAANWNPGQIAWPNNTSPGDNAQFGLLTTGRTVTVSGTVNANSLVFLDLRDGFSQDWNFSTGGTINLVGAGLINPVDGQNAVRINSVISGSVGLTLDSSGARNENAATILGGNNTYTGVTKIYDSALSLYHANALGATGTGNGTEILTKGRVLIAGSNGSATPLTIAEDITLKPGAESAAIRSSNANNILSGNVVNETADGGFNANTNHTFTLNGNITTDGGTSRRIVFGASGAATAKIVVNGSISDGDTEQTSILINGDADGTKSGTVELANSNSFTGGVVVRRGTLLLSHADAISSSGSIILGDGGLGDSTNTLRLLTNGGYTVSQPISLNSAAGSNTYTAVIGGNSAHATTFSGGITINDANAGTYQLTAASGGTVEFAGVIQDGAQIKAIAITGAGTVIFSRANTYDGATTIASGATLQLGNGSNNGSIASSSSLTNSGTLIFDRSDNLTQGTQFPSTIGGTGALVKNGSGQLNLSGNNTSTAGFTINRASVFVTHNNALGADANVVTLDATAYSPQLGLNADGLTIANPIRIESAGNSVTRGHG